MLQARFVLGHHVIELDVFLVRESIGFHFVFQHLDSHPCAGERRVQKHPSPGDAGGNLRTVRARSVRLFVDAVDDCVDARFQRVNHALRGRAVRGGVYPKLVRLVTYSRKLIHVERRAQSMGRSCAAARGCDLDEICALFDKLANAGPAFVRASGLDSEVTQMPANNRHRPAREQQPWRRSDAHLHCVS